MNELKPEQLENERGVLTDLTHVSRVVNAAGQTFTVKQMREASLRIRIPIVATEG